MERDAALLHRVSGLLRIAGGTGNTVDFDQVIDEIWSTALVEMDFSREAAQAEEFARLNESVAYVSSPHVLRKYSAESVLTMEYVDGLSIDDRAGLIAAGYDPAEIGAKLAENYVKQIVDDGFFHADPHPGNLRVSGGKIVWLDMGMIGRLSQHDRRLFRGAISAAVRGDVNELCGLLLVFCDAKGPVDRPRLFSDVDSLMSRYESLDVGSMNLLEIRDSVVAAAERNGLSLPKGVTILGRGLVTLEGVLSTLSPDISMMEVMVNHLSAKAIDYFEPAGGAQKSACRAGSVRQAHPAYPLAGVGAAENDDPRAVEDKRGVCGFGAAAALPRQCRRICRRRPYGVRFADCLRHSLHGRRAAVAAGPHRARRCRFRPCRPARRPSAVGLAPAQGVSKKMGHDVFRPRYDISHFIGWFS